MKKYISVFFLFAFMVSCASDNNEKTNDTDVVSDNSEIICSVTPLKDVTDDIATRSNLTVGSNGMDFTWQYGDKITIFSDAENNGNFTTSGETSSARFTGGGFSLIKGQRYYAFSKSTTKCKDANGVEWNNAPSDFDASSWTNVKASYLGQRQTVNYSASNAADATAHLGKYDYMASTAVAYDTNGAKFEFQHLGLTILCCIKGLPANKAFKSLQIYDASDDNYRRMSKSINLTNGLSGDNYSPAWNTVDAKDLTESDERFSIALGPNEETGLSVANDGDILYVFMEVPPFDFTGKTVVFHLDPVNSNDQAYYFTYTPSSTKGMFEAGTSRQIIKTAQPCTKFTINVKVVKDWEKGNVVTQTRSTGDPGTTTTLVKPTHLYAFFINNGRLITRAYAENISESNWTDADGMFTYTGSWKTKTDEKATATEATKLEIDAQSGTEPKVYIIASDQAINFTDKNFTYGTSSGTDESVIQSMTYTYSDQTHMLNLYSTPYNSTYKSFVGALTDEFKDVKLYHVASKVDINWESASALSGSVSVNDFPTSNLSFFKPTTGNTTPGTSSVSEAITTGTMYNGRAVFYLPQPYNTSNKKASYSVTLGSTQSIDFTPDATYTSWFRGLVTVKNYPNQ